MSEWISCNDRLPHHNQSVAVLASLQNYNSGYLQTLAGWFHKTYYDTTINRFSLIGVGSAPWRVAYWMPLPEPIGYGPFDPGFDGQFKWLDDAKHE